MEKWEKAVNKFLESWKKKKYVLGALLTGSYAVGESGRFSDVDVHIVLSDDVNWRERGNVMVDGFLVEYFANPLRQLKKYQEDDFLQGRRTDARMFTIGKILFDEKGAVKRFQDDSRKLMKKKFKKPDKARVESAKYFLWDEMENLRDLFDGGSPAMDFLYYTLLNRILNTYADYLGAELPAPSKLDRFVESDDFRKRYLMEPFPDDDFIEMAMECVQAVNMGKIEALTEYTMEKMGGFEIDGWKLRTPAE